MLFSLLFIGCDDMKSLMSLIPKFESSLPNVISGKFAYYENETDQSQRIYTELYEFDPINRTFTHSVAGEDEERKGSYTYAYSDFIITECNGFLTLAYEDGTSAAYAFKYEATAVGGPVSITLRQDNVDKVLIFEP